jgi:hypothetical protein
MTFRRNFSVGSEDRLQAEIERLWEALRQIKELETLDDGKLSTSGEIAHRALTAA